MNRLRIACLLLLAALAGADTVYVKGGKKLKGVVVREEPDVVVNPYNSTVEGMVFGVERVPKDKVRKIVRTLPAPHHEFQRRVQAILAQRRRELDQAREAESWGMEDEPADGPDAATACFELAGWCLEQKLKAERAYALELTLRFDPAHAEARKALGSKAPKGDWSKQHAQARQYVEADDGAARAEALAAIRKDRSAPWNELALKRAWRSHRLPRGYHEDRPLALRADKLMDGARYTISVPKGYDPLVATPLVVGLHGGGAGGADGKLVVGSGPQAMPFYRRACEERGWICVCPTALRAGWGSRPNNELIDAMLEELFALYNIDENRIYLTGHSMGGGGSWVQGDRLAETWAAVAPTASFGVRGISRFEKTRTGFYVYHSDDDPRTRIGGVRPLMENLPGSGADFVYTELPGRGHSLPGEVVLDVFRFFDQRTLARGPGRFKPTVRPRSSFRRKVSRDEKKYLPALDLDKEGAGEDRLSPLLKDLRTGGGVAEAAVPKLIAHADPKTSSRVARVLLKASGPDVRRYAARVLGGRKAKDEIDALGRVLLVEVEMNALLEVLGALGEIGDLEAGPHLLKFLRKRRQYFDQRKQGSDMSHSDWITILPPMARACSLAGTYQPSKAAETIVQTVFDGVFLSGVKVVYDSQNQNPLPAAVALARAACTALARLQEPAGRAGLERMAKAGRDATAVERTGRVVKWMSGWAGDPAIAASVREALDE